MVLGERVGTGDPPPDGLQQEWARIKCSTARAYGCGEHGQKLLDGLSLYIRLVKPRCVTTHHRALHPPQRRTRLFKPFGRSDAPPIPIDDAELSTSASVVSATNDQVLVLAVVFKLQRFFTRIYYIVYDAIDGSLTMLPAPPDPSCVIRGMPKPLPMLLDRSDGSAAPGYELVFMAEKLVPHLPGQGYYNTYEDVLYRWTTISS